MRNIIQAAAAAALLSFAAAPVIAQPASGTDKPAPADPAEASPTEPKTPDAASASAAGADASVTTGMTVKDKTGAAIGQVTDVKTDAAGKTIATIRMGGDIFGVETSRLAVGSGAATINATEADIKGMLKK